jgi:chromate transporter
MEDSTADHQMPSWREVFSYFLFLGFVNIGGPVAQITMMFNHMVEKRRWLSKDRFIKIMAFCHMLPGPEALQLAIYVGYLKRKLWGGVLAGVTFIVPGAIAMIVLSWLYVRFGKLSQVTDALYVLKPAVLGIIAAGIIKLGRASIETCSLRFCSSARLWDAFRRNQFPADSSARRVTELDRRAWLKDSSKRLRRLCRDACRH